MDLNSETTKVTPPNDELRFSADKLGNLELKGAVLVEKLSEIVTRFHNIGIDGVYFELNKNPKLPIKITSDGSRGHFIVYMSDNGELYSRLNSKINDVSATINQRTSRIFDTVFNDKYESIPTGIYTTQEIISRVTTETDKVGKVDAGIVVVEKSENKDNYEVYSPIDQRDKREINLDPLFNQLLHLGKSIV